MTRRTKFASLLTLGSALIVSSAAYSQYPGGGSSYPGSSGSSYPGSSGGSSYPGGGGGTTGGASDMGSVDSSAVTTTDTTVTTDTTTIPNTGGEPLLMTLLGSMVAGSALMLRRKLS